MRTSTLCFVCLIPLVAVAGDGPPNEHDAFRKQVIANFEKVAGTLPDLETPVPLDVKVLGEERLDDGVLRRKIAYHSDSTDAVVGAYLLLPAMEPGEKRPGVLVCHSTQAPGKLQPAGLAGIEDKHIALHLARRGYIAIAPDYPSFGEAKNYDFAADDYESGAMKAIYDNIRAVDLLCSLPEVDEERIGAIGHSLGGHTVIFAALYDERIKAVVSNCGFTRFHRYYGGDLTGWTSERYFPRIATLYGKDPDRMPFDFPDLISALAPRAFLASSPIHDANFDVTGVKETITAAKPTYERLGAAGRLQANYPDCAHAFPTEVRQVAYEFLDEQLGHTPKE